MPRLAVLALFASIAASAPVLGCASSSSAPASPLQYAEDAERTYKKAEGAFLDKDWEEARILFQEVKRKYAYSRFARLAELRIADIDFEQEKFSTAITGYRAFVHDHRTDAGAAYARFRICRALFSQVSDTLLLPPQEERDQASIHDAYRELSSFLLDHPDSKWTKEAKFMLVSVTDRLVRHELYVARYLLRQDRFEPAAKRIQYALRTYDGSGLEAEAMVLLGETYLKMKRGKEARELLSQVVKSYPASPFADVAGRYLAAVGP